MYRPFVALLFSLVCLIPRSAGAQELPPQVQAVLKQIKAVDKDLLAVSEEDGRFMRLLVATSRAKRALEIGTASGYSAIWIAMGLRETGGRALAVACQKVRRSS